jgi:hypothetical protein
MLAIPVDVLIEILEHVDKNDLATICRVNKTCCSYSQNVLYRKIYDGNTHVIQTLARSIDLARRVRWFNAISDCPELATALRNMSSLRRLGYEGFDDDASILDGCTFKLDSFSCTYPYSKSLQNFLNSQSSLTILAIYDGVKHPPPFDKTFLPNLTRVTAKPCWIRMLIPGRPVREVLVIEPWGEEDSIDFSIFTLSTAPIRKLHISYSALFPTRVSHIASIFPFLEHLTIRVYDMDWLVRIPPLYLSIGVNAQPS